MKASMLKICLAMLLGLVSACVTPPEVSAVDAQFGNAVSSAVASQTSLTEKTTKPPVPMDGQAAKSSIDRYQKSFETPPSSVNVFSSGSGVGASSNVR
jgi:hypothetical protein